MLRNRAEPKPSVHLRTHVVFLTTEGDEGRGRSVWKDTSVTIDWFGRCRKTTKNTPKHQLSRRRQTDIKVADPSQQQQQQEAPGVMTPVRSREGGNTEMWLIGSLFPSFRPFRMHTTSKATRETPRRADARRRRLSRLFLLHSAGGILFTLNEFSRD